MLDQLFSVALNVTHLLTLSFLLILGVKNGMKGESGASDDELTSDVLSHYSSASESTSVLEEGTGLCTKPDNSCTCFFKLCLFWITAKLLLTYCTQPVFYSAL